MAYFSPNEWPRVALMRPDFRATLLVVMQEFEDETGLTTYVPERGGVRLDGVQALVFHEAEQQGFRAAPPGESEHEYGAAGDLVIVGKGPQNAERDQRDPDYRRLAEISKRHGLRPGFFYNGGKPDPYHHGTGETLAVMRAKWDGLKKKGSSLLPSFSLPASC